MPHLSVTTNQRGPLFTMALTVIKLSNKVCKEMETKCYNVYGLVEVVGKVKLFENTDTVKVFVGLKKSTKAKEFPFSVNISCWGHNRQLICQDEWVEIYIISAQCVQTYIQHFQGGIFLCTIPVNISIHATTIQNYCVHQNVYEDTEFTDCTLQAEDGSVVVHKIILLSHGEFFRTLLRGEWKETKEGSINMAGATVQTLKHLKAYMYTGTLPEEGLEELLLIAKRCLMDNLATECINKILESVKPDTFNDLVEFACQNNMFDLVKAFLRLPDNKITQIGQLDIQKKLLDSSNGDKK